MLFWIIVIETSQFYFCFCRSRSLYGNDKSRDERRIEVKLRFAASPLLLMLLLLDALHE